MTQPGSDDRPPPEADHPVPDLEATQPLVVPEPGLPLLAPPPAVPAAPSPFAGLPLTARALVPAAFDLLARSERDLRGASFYIGFLVLVTTGPAAVLLWALFIRYGEDIGLALEGPASAPFAIVAIVGALGFIVAAVESRTLATAVLGGRLEGRPLTVGGAVVLARLRFWRALWFGALIALLTGIANIVVESIVTESQVAFVATLLVGLLVEAPFVYGITGIVLGEVGIGDALFRSTTLFGVRPRLAVTVSLFGIASQFILLLALFAGLDIVARIVEPIGLDAQSDVSAFLGTIVIGVLLFAFGTLLFTAASFAAAAQVLAFAGLTHYARGLEAGRRPFPATRPWDPFVTRALAIGLIVGLLTLLGSLLPDGG